MKIRTLKSIACAAAIALALSVTACGGSKDSSNEAGTSEAVDAAAPEEAGADEAASSEEAGADDAAGSNEADVEEETGADDAEFSSLEEAFSDPTVKKVFEDALGLGGMDEDGMSISYEVSGNEFIYIFQFTDDSIEASDEITDYLESALAEQADVFKEAAGELDEAIGQEGACSVTVRYLDANNGVLYENTYSAN